jgi:hypothetical protein
VRGAELDVKPLRRAWGLDSPGSCLISVGVVVLALGFAPGLQAGRTGASISETTQQSATERKTWQAEFATSSIDRDSFPEYLETDSAAASFDERFTAAVDSRVDSQNTTPHRLQSSHRDAQGGDQRAVGRSGRESAPFATLPPAANMKLVRVADASTQEDSSLLSDAAARIAIYDIAAHRVYLPKGQRLEAHSGLGKYRDDPRHVSEKDRGPTPPNV